jgi:antitoxin HigA-1
MDIKNNMRPIHPGEILREEFLVPLGMSAHALAIQLKVPAPRIYAIMNEQRVITPDTALRLANYFGTTPEFWLNLQTAYDLKVAQRELGPRINKEVRSRNAAWFLHLTGEENGNKTCQVLIIELKVKVQALKWYPFLVMHRWWMIKNKSKGIKSWPEDDRPREKLLKRGASALSNSELLAILLRTGVEGNSEISKYWGQVLYYNNI